MLKFDDEFDGKANLVCPCCGDTYTHQGTVTVWDRSEDASQPLITTAHRGGGTIVSLGDNTLNPSARRQGLEIRFTCEQGCTFDVTFAQHKGVTQVGYRNVVPYVDQPHDLIENPFGEDDDDVV